MPSSSTVQKYECLERVHAKNVRFVGHMHDPARRPTAVFDNKPEMPIPPHQFINFGQRMLPTATARGEYSGQLTMAGRTHCPHSKVETYRHSSSFHQREHCRKVRLVAIYPNRGYDSRFPHESSGASEALSLFGADGNGIVRKVRIGLLQGLHAGNRKKESFLLGNLFTRTRHHHF
jgi:hypothetical protein